MTSRKEEKKVFARDLRVNDNLIYQKPGSRYGLQSVIQEIQDLGLLIRVRIIGDEWLTFNANSQVSLQMAEPFDNHTLHNRSSVPQTVLVGNRKIGIE